MAQPLYSILRRVFDVCETHAPSRWLRENADGHIGHEGVEAIVQACNPHFKQHNSHLNVINLEGSAALELGTTDMCTGRRSCA